jgi:hypothetical protein
MPYGEADIKQIQKLFKLEIVSKYQSTAIFRKKNLAFLSF